jgi:hypothetical protein
MPRFAKPSRGKHDPLLLRYPNFSLKDPQVLLTERRRREGRAINDNDDPTLNAAESSLPVNG